MRALLAAVVLGGAFGSASATVESIQGDVMVVELTVEVRESAESVVAHLSFQGQPELTLPLLDRGGGIFGLRTELEPKNYFVVFETVGSEGQRSEPVSLTDLGAELGPDRSTSTATEVDDELSEESQRMLWLAIALGAASLSLLAFWTLGGRDDEGAREAAAGEEDASEEE
ncbi:MAG TPA: hypothetical protein VMP13_04620 [Acidimicrobiia bacterium]|nr:hypothetical protein [Acidimicrobiia bacterium]